MRTLRELIKDGEKRLLENNIENSTMEARVLLEYICGFNWAQYLLQADTEADPQEERRYIEAVERRCGHYPLQYILGTTGFMGLEFMVNESVLIPRQDTETLVETVLEKADISGDALRTARMNGIFNCQAWQKDGRTEESLEWIQSDLFSEVRGTFDVIVSNPPYIPGEVIETLMPEVRDFEPRLALEGADRGLEFYRKITDRAADYLKPSGWLFYEIGCEQAAEVSQMMAEKGFKEIHTVRDLAGLDRVVYGRR